MKKLLFVALLCLCGLAPIRAQYHITGDTVALRDSIWWWPQWYINHVDSIPPKSLGRFSEWTARTYEVLYEHHTDRPIRVIGIAACVYGINRNNSMITDSMTGAQEYFYIYKRRVTGDEVPLRMVPWNPHDSCRYIQNCRMTPISPDCNELDIYCGSPKPLFEMYFEDNPLVLTDTFYIGMSGYSDTLIADGYNVLPVALTSRPSGAGNCAAPIPWQPIVITSYREEWTLPLGKPVRSFDNGIGYIFPILSQDTDFTYLDSCPAATNIYLDTTGGASLLRWDSDSLHTQWQVAISDTSATATRPLIDTLVDTNYLDLDSIGIAPPIAVQVRPHCLCYQYYDVWGNWGDRTTILPLLTPDTTTIDTTVIDTTVIDTTTIDTTALDTTWISPVVDQHTHLYPNPTSGKVAITSSIPLRSVALYDPTGRCILRRQTDGTTLHLDLNGYAKGSYHIVIDTPIGHTVKRIIIQ